MTEIDFIKMNNVAYAGRITFDFPKEQSFNTKGLPVITEINSEFRKVCFIDEEGIYREFFGRSAFEFKTKSPVSIVLNEEVEKFLKCRNLLGGVAR